VIREEYFTGASNPLLSRTRYGKEVVGCAGLAVGSGPTALGRVSASGGARPGCGQQTGRTRATKFNGTIHLANTYAREEATEYARLQHS
jgi:hypothetical protein